MANSATQPAWTDNVARGAPLDVLYYLENVHYGSPQLDLALLKAICEAPPDAVFIEAGLDECMHGWRAGPHLGGFIQPLTTHPNAFLPGEDVDRIERIDGRWYAHDTATDATGSGATETLARRAAALRGRLNSRR